MQRLRFDFGHGNFPQFMLMDIWLVMTKLVSRLVVAPCRFEDTISSKIDWLSGIVVLILCDHVPAFDA